jgi:hypothetical protein
LGLAYEQASVQRIEVDTALQAVFDDLAKRRVVSDPVLGELTLERDLSWYGGKRSGMNGTYEVAVQTSDPDDEPTVAAAVARAGAVVQGLEAALPAILDAIVGKMFNVYNSTWRQRAPALTSDEFKSRLALSSIVIGDKRTTAYLDCDSLFTDHVIEVRMAPDGRITEICLAG